MRLSTGFGLLGVTIAVFGVLAVNGNRVAPYLVIAAGVVLVFLAIWVQVKAEEIKLNHITKDDQPQQAVDVTQADPFIVAALEEAVRTGKPVSFTLSPLGIDSTDLSKPVEEDVTDADEPAPRERGVCTRKGCGRPFSEHEGGVFCP